MASNLGNQNDYTIFGKYCHRGLLNARGTFVKRSVIGLVREETQTNRSAALSHMHHVNIHIIQQERASIAQFPFNPILQE